MTVDLTKHAEAISAIFADTPPHRQHEAILSACAALFDAGAQAMREALAADFEANNPQLLCCSGHECGCMGATVGEYDAHLIRQMDPTTLREVV
jgi:hypothetical protein